MKKAELSRIIPSMNPKKDKALALQGHLNRCGMMPMDQKALLAIQALLLLAADSKFGNISECRDSGGNASIGNMGRHITPYMIKYINKLEVLKKKRETMMKRR